MHSLIKIQIVSQIVSQKVSSFFISTAVALTKGTALPFLAKQTLPKVIDPISAHQSDCQAKAIHNKPI